MLFNSFKNFLVRLLLSLAHSVVIALIKTETAANEFVKRKFLLRTIKLTSDEKEIGAAILFVIEITLTFFDLAYLAASIVSFEYGGKENAIIRSFFLRNGICSINDVWL